MVLFQDKIIYMPSLPPNARLEKLEDYAKACAPVKWEEERIRSLDGTRISLAIGRLTTATESEKPRIQQASRKHVVIAYLQGNASSLPPRAPILSDVLKTAAKNSAIDFTLIALSYRGYWTSSGRASQAGIERDAEALMQWIDDEYPDRKNVELVLWGQSIGAGVACDAAAKYLSRANDRRIHSLILETPFASIRSMLVAIYPQKWLPYRYLWPFLWNWWDSEQALRTMARTGQAPKVLLMPSSKDELVPPEQADQLERLCKDLKLDLVRKDVSGALHQQASMWPEGRKALAKYLSERHL